MVPCWYTRPSRRKVIVKVSGWVEAGLLMLFIVKMIELPIAIVEGDAGKLLIVMTLPVVSWVKVAKLLAVSVAPVIVLGTAIVIVSTLLKVRAMVRVRVAVIPAWTVVLLGVKVLAWKPDATVFVIVGAQLSMRVVSECCE